MTELTLMKERVEKNTKRIQKRHVSPLKSGKNIYQIRVLSPLLTDFGTTNQESNQNLYEDLKTGTDTFTDYTYSKNELGSSVLRDSSIFRKTNFNYRSKGEKERGLMKKYESDFGPVQEEEWEEQ